MSQQSSDAIQLELNKAVDALLLAIERHRLTFLYLAEVAHLGYRLVSMEYLFPETAHRSYKLVRD